MCTFDRFDILEAHYWFGHHYSGGQFSPEYERACRAGEHYNPGPLCSGPSSVNAAEIYNKLEREHGYDETPYQVLNSGAIWFPSFENDASLILSDARGVYIPRDFCDGITEADCERLSIDWEDVQCCQRGPEPENEWYWEAWQSILDNCSFTDDNGRVWGLYQDGDVWETPAGCYPREN
jgi:hypothetical protein